MSKGYSPRSNLRGRRHFNAGFGARHPIVKDKGASTFFSELDQRWSEILPKRSSLDLELAGLSEGRYKLYDDPRKMGVTVLERRLSAKHARQNRLQWNTNDAGRVRRDIADEISRLGLTGRGLEMTLTTPVRVGDADRRSRGGKFALIPEFTDGTAGLLASEHEIVVNGLRGVFKQFRYPYDDYTPKMTVGRVFRGAEPEQVEACAAELDNLISEHPLTVTLEPIVFFAHQEL